MHLQAMFCSPNHAGGQHKQHRSWTCGHIGTAYFVPAADLFVYQLNTEDTGRLGATLAEGPLGPFLHQPGLDSPVHVVGVQGSNGQHCLLGRAH